MVHGTDKTMRRAAKMLGIGFGLVALVMTASAGADIGGDNSRAAYTIGFGFALVSIGTSILPYFIDSMWRSGSRVSAGFFMGVLAVFGCAEYGAHVMYTVGHRQIDASRAIHTDVVYDGITKGADETKARLDIFSTRLADLKAANPWAASTTPDSIIASIISMEGDKLFKRSKQCANVTVADSRAFCDRYADAKGKLAVIVELNRLPGQIEATQKVVDEARSKLANAKQGESRSLDQSMLFASVGTQNLRPSADAIQWTGMSIGAFVSFVFTIAGAVFMFIGFRDPLENEPEYTVKRTAPLAKPATPVQSIADAASKFAFDGFTLATMPGLGVVGKLRKAA